MGPKLLKNHFFGQNKPDHNLFNPVSCRGGSNFKRNKTTFWNKLKVRKKSYWQKSRWVGNPYMGVGRFWDSYQPWIDFLYTCSEKTSNTDFKTVEHLKILQVLIFFRKKVNFWPCHDFFVNFYLYYFVFPFKPFKHHNNTYKEQQPPKIKKILDCKARFFLICAILKNWNHLCCLWLF